MKKFYSPRWRNQFCKITATTRVSLPSQFFANNEIWDWHLSHLVLVGDAVVHGTGHFTTVQGGVARRLRLQVGISQKGDINLVSSNGQAMFGPSGSLIQHSNVLNVGAAFKFDSEFPYELPKDTGLGVVVRNDGPGSIANLGALFMGYREAGDEALEVETKATRNPVHIGGYTDKNLQSGNQDALDSADLYNRGDREAVLTDMVLHGFILNAGQDGTDNAWSKVSYRINPTTGPLWMPDPAPIPVGCLCPFNRAPYDAYDQGPRAYVFPPGTKLEPRQRLSVEITNISEEDQEVHVCLFGHLEVT